MDEGDYGQDYQARLNAEAIARHRELRRQEAVRGDMTGKGSVFPDRVPRNGGDFPETGGHNPNSPVELVQANSQFGLCPPNSEFLPCSWCGEEIPEARRKAVPGCELCVDCQAMRERFPERRI